MIERMYLKGAGPTTIHQALSQTAEFKDVAIGTVRNDIVAIRREWKATLDAMRVGDYAPEYVAQAMADRQAAHAANNIPCAYAILKDVAGLLGVEFRDPTMVVEDNRLPAMTKEELDAAVQGDTEFLDKLVGESGEDDS